MKNLVKDEIGNIKIITTLNLYRYRLHTKKPVFGYIYIGHKISWETAAALIYASVNKIL